MIRRKGIILTTAALLMLAGAVVAIAKPAYDIRNRTNVPPLSDKESYVAWMLKNTKEEERYVREKWDRLQQDIAWYHDQPDVLKQCFLLTPRQYFARPYNSKRVYEHSALPIEDGQTISGPHLQLRMTLSILPTPDMKVLEIGTGSGNQSAMLAQLSNHVYTIEIKENAFNTTKAIYDKHRADYPMYNNVHMVHADGYNGWKAEYGWDEEGPIEFDRIIVTCGIDHIPPPLLNQLKPNGIMVIPVGTRTSQAILKVTKKVDDKGNITIVREDIYGGRLKERFVPFTSADGGIHSKTW
jgi:protein-L-isoaspartate(D-aspartate) O-methyltransferase